MSFSELMYKGYLGEYLETVGTKTGVGFFVLIVVAFLLITIVPYVLGSLNCAIIITKKLYHDDIRSHGSGNAGMTNMLRTYGTKMAVLTLLCDASKAVVSILVGRLVFGIIGAYVAGLACIVGHVFPLFYKFKGGKGVVTVAVTIFMTNWKVGLVLLFMFLVLVGFSKFVSLGSVMCMLIYPLILDRINMLERIPAPKLVMLFAMAMTVLIVAKHAPNIKRLVEGTESKISFTRKGKDPSSERTDKK